MAKRYLGYNFAAPIRGSVIPQRLQNLCIRDYARARGLALTFTVAEYWDHEAALMLFAQFGHGSEMAGFVFYSLDLLPSAAPARARLFAALRDKKLEIHFALEELALLDSANDAEVARIDRMYRLRTDDRLERTREELIALRRAR